MPRLRPAKEQLQPQLRSGPDLFDSSVLEQNMNEEDTNKEVAEVVVEKKPEVDAAAELKKQIEALKRGEAEQRRRADQAEQDRIRAAKEASQLRVEVEKTKTEVVQSRADVINRAISAETEAADTAEREYVSALSAGDNEAAVKAQRRLARAEANLANLMNGKAAIELEIKEAENRPEVKQQQTQNPTVEQVIDSWDVPNNAKQWLKAHPDYITVPKKNAQIQYLHRVVVDDEGQTPFSAAYYESLETHLGLRTKEVTRTKDQDDDGGESIVSAPVSREVPGSSGTRNDGVVKLTPAQREAAKASGITETEYAKQLLKLRKEKEAGSYGEQR